MAFQLCTRDEYGAMSILKTSQNLADLVDTAKKLVSTENMENALTLSEQKTSWTAYYIEILDEDGELIDNAVYAGKTGSGKDKIYLVNGDAVEESRLDSVSVKLRFYIGEMVTDRKNNKVTVLYAERPSSRKPGASILLDKLTDREMEGKTVYYINKTK